MEPDSESDRGGGGDPALLADRYRVIEKIGAGGMAVVSLAEDTRLGRRVAIKRLHADSPDDAARRFLREAKLGAALSHPNLVTIFDAFAEGHNLVIVMEHIAGPDLGEALRSGPLEAGEAVSVLGDVAAALDHTHAAGIIHRDVKPSNVLLAPDGSARLTDLGIARVVEDTQTTQVGMVVGSTPYMSPEQLRGEAVGPAADVYALALTAYEALSGEPARSGMPAQIIYQTTEAPPPDIREVRPGTAPAVADALKRGMALRPGDRPESAGALVAELALALEARTVGERATEEQAPPATAGPVPAPAQASAPEPAPPRREPSPAPPIPTRTAQPAPPPDRGRLVRRLSLGLLALLIAAVAVVAISSLGGEDSADESASVSTAPETPATEPDPEPREPSGGGRAGEEPTGGAVAGSPKAAVQDFYELAAADDFDGAVAVASPNLESLLGGPSGIEGTLGTLQEIEFTTLEVISQSDSSAELEVATIATHTDFVDECSGTASVVADGDGWLLDQIGFTC